jgi:deoxyribodipyrimidine photolyase
MVQAVWFKRDLRIEDQAALAADLRARGLGLTVETGDAVNVFERLHRTHGEEAIHAHEETGLL